MHAVRHEREGVAWEMHTRRHLVLLGYRIGSLRRHVRHWWDKILQERPTDNQDTCLSPPLGLSVWCVSQRWSRESRNWTLLGVLLEGKFSG